MVNCCFESLVAIFVCSYLSVAMITSGHISSWPSSSMVMVVYDHSHLWPWLIVLFDCLWPYSTMVIFICGHLRPWLFVHGHMFPWPWLYVTTIILVCGHGWLLFLDPALGTPMELCSMPW